ncbi:MAG: type II toxin-antitoxin system VapC family toxin [Calditrichaceae bacterium]|jgi:predicted nucleic-acid-binding protein
MIGIDTNILIRYITQDDEIQSELATKFIEKNCTVTKPGYVNQIVICEIIWILRRAYVYDKKLVIQVVEKLLRSSEIVVENSPNIWKALNEYENGNADFSDYLIALSNNNSGCDFTITFDKKASGNKLFKILS